MAGTKAGGLKAAQKNLARDPDFYAKIGRKGGKNGRTGGFAANPALARIAGAKGGRISRRTKKTGNKKLRIRPLQSLKISLRMRGLFYLISFKLAGFCLIYTPF